MDEPQGLDAFLSTATPQAQPMPAGDASASEPPGLSDFIAPEMLEEQYGGPTGALVAGASHVVNTALPGVGPKLQDMAGLSYETQKKLTEANPIAAGVGDISAFARGAGAAGVIGNVGKAVGSTVPAGMVSKALQYGTEGALLGASNVINDSVLGDPNLTAQKALTDIGIGAALGIAAAPVAEFAERALPFATKSLSKALNGIKAVAVGTAEEPGVAVNAIARASSLTNGKPLQSNIDALFAGIERGETTIPKVSKNMEEVFSHGTKVSDALTSDIEKELATTEKARPISNFPTKEELRVGNAMDRGEEAMIHPISEGTLKTKAMLDDYQIAANEFQREFMNKARTKIEPEKIEALYKDPLSPETIVKKEIANNYIKSASDVLSASENYADYKQAETSLSKMINHLAKESVETHETLKALAGGEPLAARLAKSAVTGMGASMLGVPKPVVGAVLSAVEAYKTLRNPYEMGSALNNAFQKIKAFAEINEKVGEKMGSLSKSIFSNSGVRNASIPSTVSRGLPTVANTDGYDKKVERIGELASNQRLMTDKLASHTEDLYDVAPNVSAAIHSSLLSSAQFLASKIPHPQGQSLLTSGEWKPSEAAKQKFMTYYRAVNTPLSALKDIKMGTLNDETMEALTATQPHLLNEMRSHVMEHIDPKKAKNLPYAVKISLSKFMGEPLDDGLLPSVIMSNQMSFIGPQQSEQNAPRTPRTTQSGLKSLSLANRSETETQQHEKEEM